MNKIILTALIAVAFVAGTMVTGIAFADDDRGKKTR